VSAVRRARPPRGALYRIGRLPDPIGWPPWEVAGGGRFDDPGREFRVLYAAVQRRGAFVETLAAFRPSVESLARLQDLAGRERPILMSTIPADWYQRRAVARLRLLPGQVWLDLRVPETRETLRAELATTLQALGLCDLDLSRVLGHRRALTQAIARWAYENGYSGLTYHSRLDHAHTLWAIFEGSAFEPVGLPDPITSDDADLAATARLYGLTL